MSEPGARRRRRRRREEEKKKTRPDLQIHNCQQQKLEVSKNIRPVSVTYTISLIEKTEDWRSMASKLKVP